jgi:predicted permease
VHDVTHIVSLSALGAVAGGLGLAIAVYLQFMTDRHVAARYVSVYFMFGAFLMLGNAGIVPFLTDAEVAVAAWLAILLSIVGQIVGFMWLVESDHAESPTEVAESFLEQTDEAVNGDDPGADDGG